MYFPYSRLHFVPIDKFSTIRKMYVLGLLYYTAEAYAWCTTMPPCPDGDLHSTRQTTASTSTLLYTTKASLDRVTKVSMIELILFEHPSLEQSLMDTRHKYLCYGAFLFRIHIRIRIRRHLAYSLLFCSILLHFAAFSARQQR